MNLDTIQLYGPGMSFYLSKSNPKSTGSSSVASGTTSSSMASTVGSASTTSATSTISTSSTNSLSNYSAALVALQTSNEDLETRMSKVCFSSLRLNRDLLKLRRHVDSFHHECLSTWQADILTRLIEVVYARQRRKLPWGVVIGKHETQDWEIVSRAYVIAAERIGKKVLAQKLGLGSKYHDALRKYGEIVEFRSSNPFQSERPFAQYLISEKENNTALYAFWAKLFPLCYGRIVEESAEVN